MKACPDCARLEERVRMLEHHSGRLSRAMQRLRTEINLATADVNGVTTPVTALELTVRTCNVLHANNINTVGELTALSAQDLGALKGMGKRSVKEIITTLTDLRLELRP